jgi:hypothetical protein
MVKIGENIKINQYEYQSEMESNWEKKFNFRSDLEKEKVIRNNLDSFKFTRVT